MKTRIGITLGILAVCVTLLSSEAKAGAKADMGCGAYNTIQECLAAENQAQQHRQQGSDPPFYIHNESDCDVYVKLDGYNIDGSPGAILKANTTTTIGIEANTATITFWTGTRWGRSYSIRGYKHYAIVDCESDRQLYMKR